MSSGFQKTVNLKGKTRSEREGEIDNLYSERSELQKISQPKPRKDNWPLFRKVLFFLVIILFFSLIYFFFLRGHIFQENSGKNASWYAVKLASEEIFYGQIKNTSADPITMSNVYYDYDQQKGGGAKTTDNNTLRLVKRGGEAYGPDGTVEIVRSQVVYMEPLKEDSKVLEAILNYEK
ncbi:MAG: hypothetical protein WC582_03520 [Patescibacteria group bacterium]|jgi:hypothetical protein